MLRNKQTKQLINKFVIRTCFCDNHVFFSPGKTKTIIKNDQLVKKKLADYKVAYVTLVSGYTEFVIHLSVRKKMWNTRNALWLRGSTAGPANKRKNQQPFITCTPVWGDWTTTDK